MRLPGPAHGFATLSTSKAVLVTPGVPRARLCAQRSARLETSGSDRCGHRDRRPIYVSQFVHVRPMVTAAGLAASTIATKPTDQLTPHMTLPTMVRNSR